MTSEDFGILDERIDDDKHFRLIGDFECYENSSLEIFLKCEATKYERESQGSTYLIRDKKEILAFYTLKCNAIQMDDIERKGAKVAVPSIELARFAVKSGIQRQGWGTAIFINYILPKIMQVKEIIAVKLVMVFVEEDDTNAINFYQKLGFKLAKEEIQNFIEETYSDRCKIMYFNLNKSDKIEEELNKD